jgi:hypothetical protein
MAFPREKNGEFVALGISRFCPNGDDYCQGGLVANSVK